MMIFVCLKVVQVVVRSLTLVVRSGCKTSYCSLRIFIGFVKLIVVLDQHPCTEQSNVRSQNGSCASNSLTLVFLNFLRFYCLPRSLESLYVSFSVLSNLFRGKLVVIHTAIVSFFKSTIIRFVVPPKFCISIVFNFSWGERPIVYSFTSQFCHRIVKF